MLEACGALEVDVGIERLETAWGDVVSSPESMESQQFLWYYFFTSGIRQFRFEAGFDLEATLNFVGVIHEVAHSSLRAEEDAVTMLWERDLDHFEYVAVDSFQAGSAYRHAFDARAPQEVRDTIAEMCAEGGDASGDAIDEAFQGARSPDVSRPAEQRLAQVTSSRERRADDTPSRTPVPNPDALDTLAEEWRAGSHLEYRAFQIQYRRFETGSKTNTCGFNPSSPRPHPFIGHGLNGIYPSETDVCIIKRGYSPEYRKIAY